LRKRLTGCKAEAQEGQEMLAALGAISDFEIMVEHCLCKIVHQCTMFLAKMENK